MVAALPAQLTQQNAVATLHTLEHALRAQAGPVVTLDARALENFDSSAIAVLLELRRNLLMQNKVLHVESWPERLQGLVTLYGVGELLQA